MGTVARRMNASSPSAVCAPKASASLTTCKPARKAQPRPSGRDREAWAAINLGSLLVTPRPPQFSNQETQVFPSQVPLQSPSAKKEVLHMIGTAILTRMTWIAAALGEVCVSWSTHCSLFIPSS